MPPAAASTLKYPRSASARHVARVYARRCMRAVACVPLHACRARVRVGACLSVRVRALCMRVHARVDAHVSTAVRVVVLSFCLSASVSLPALLAVCIAGCLCWRRVAFEKLVQRAGECTDAGVG